jgi:hypothetical protein
MYYVVGLYNQPGIFPTSRVPLQALKILPSPPFCSDCLIPSLVEVVNYIYAAASSSSNFAAMRDISSPLISLRRMNRFSPNWRMFFWVLHRCRVGLSNHDFTCSLRSEEFSLSFCEYWVFSLNPLSKVHRCSSLLQVTIYSSFIFRRSVGDISHCQVSQLIGVTKLEGEDPLRWARLHLFRLSGQINARGTPVRFGSGHNYCLSVFLNFCVAVPFPRPTPKLNPHAFHAKVATCNAFRFETDLVST